MVGVSIGRVEGPPPTYSTTEAKPRARPSTTAPPATAAIAAARPSRRPADSGQVSPKRAGASATGMSVSVASTSGATVAGPAVRSALSSSMPPTADANAVATSQAVATAGAPVPASVRSFVVIAESANAAPGGHREQPRDPDRSSSHERRGAGDHEHRDHR